MNTGKNQNSDTIAKLLKKLGVSDVLLFELMNVDKDKAMVEFTLKASCKIFNVSKTELLQSKKYYLVDARRVCLYFIGNETDMSHQDIADEMPPVSRPSVTRAIKEVETLLESDFPGRKKLKQRFWEVKKLIEEYKKQQEDVNK